MGDTGAGLLVREVRSRQLHPAARLGKIVVRTVLEHKRIGASDGAPTAVEYLTIASSLATRTLMLKSVWMDVDSKCAICRRKFLDHCMNVGTPDYAWCLPWVA